MEDFAESVERCKYLSNFEVDAEVSGFLGSTRRNVSRPTIGIIGILGSVASSLAASARRAMAVNGSERRTELGRARVSGLMSWGLD